MAKQRLSDGQGFAAFLEQYRAEYPEDVLVVREAVSADQDITAIVCKRSNAIEAAVHIFCVAQNGVALHLLHHPSRHILAQQKPSFAMADGQMNCRQPLKEE